MNFLHLFYSGRLVRANQCIYPHLVFKRKVEREFQAYPIYAKTRRFMISKIEKIFHPIDSFQAKREDKTGKTHLPSLELANT